jgi:hypothetical protein
MLKLNESVKRSGLFLLAILVAACSSEDPQTPTPNTQPPGDPPENPMTRPCPPLNSGYPGDELCILPPDPELGVQLHVGPTDYTDPAQIAEFELAPGQEVTRCYYFNTPNTEVVNFFEQHYRMRTGSHHLIMHMNTSGQTHPGGWDVCQGIEGFTPIGGTQRSISEFPIDGVTPPEDANLFRPLLPNVLFKFELHFVNSGTEPILREAWVNLKKKEVAPGDQILGGVFMIGAGMSVQPHTKEILNYKSQPLTQAKRVVSLFGHRHAHTTRFTVWAHRNGVREQIYEDYDWQEPTELSYNSVVINPAADPVKRVAGGSSGILNFAVGDSMEWECEVNNTSDNVLIFGNEVYNREMCNVFGSSTGEGTFWSGRGTKSPSQPGPAE